MQESTPVIFKLSSKIICLTTVLTPVHVPYVYLVIALLLPRTTHLAPRNTKWSWLPTKAHWTHTHNQFETCQARNIQ